MPLGFNFVCSLLQPWVANSQFSLNSKTCLRRSRRGSVLYNLRNCQCGWVFMRMVFSILSVLLPPTVMVAVFFTNLELHGLQSNSRILYASMGGFVALFSYAHCCQNQLQRPPTNFVGLGVLTVVLGVLCFDLFSSCFYNIALGSGDYGSHCFTRTIYASYTDGFTGCGPFTYCSMIVLNVGLC